MVGRPPCAASPNPRRMNARHIIIPLLLTVVTLLASCLSDDEVEVTTYSDAAMTAFSIGTLPCTQHTTGKSGQDSTYTTEKSYDTYAFTIDHTAGRVYNVDSLPAGVSTRACLPTITAKNGGYIYVKNLDNDSLRYYSSADSIDFRQPRVVRIYANDGTWSRDYTVEVRVHKESADSLYWRAQPSQTALAALGDMRGLFFRGNVVVWGIKDGVSEAYATTDGSSWRQLVLPASEGVSMATDGSRLYALSAKGELHASADLTTWKPRHADTSLYMLAGAARTELYALATDGLLYGSRDQGATWTADIPGAYAANIPTRDITAVTTVATTNADIDRVLIAGNSQSATQSTALMLTKDVDTADPSESGTWTVIPFTAATWHHAPALEHIQIVPYASGLVMIGGQGRGVCDEEAFAKVRFSRDGGLNWWTDKRLFLPQGFSASPTSFALVADDTCHLWLIAGGSGQVWRGYLSQLTWQ